MTAHGDSRQLRRPRAIVGARERLQLLGEQLLGVRAQEFRHANSESMAARIAATSHSRPMSRPPSSRSGSTSSVGSMR